MGARKLKIHLRIAVNLAGDDVFRRHGSHFTRLDGELYWVDSRPVMGGKTVPEQENR
jgi:hypothetical protein